MAKNEAAIATKTPRTKKVLGAEDFPSIKSAKQLDAEERAALRKIGRETGAKPALQIEAEQRAAKAGGAKLANGLNARNAPHSSKSVGDNAAAEKKAAKAAPKAAAKGKAPAAPKAAKAEKASRGDDLGSKLTVLVKAKDTELRPDSGRYAKLAAAEKAKTLGDWLGKEVADATGKMHKCDRGALAGMLKRGHVKVG